MTSVTIPLTADSVKVAPQLLVRVLHSFADAESFREAWNALVLRSGAGVYQTFDWCRLWWQYYGAQRHLHILLCFSGEELVGLVPAFIETLRLGPARIRVAKLVGADFTLNLCNLPVVSEALPSVGSWAIRHFFGKHRCDLLLFGPLSGPSARIEELCRVGNQEHELVGKTEILGNSCNTYFHLPESFDEYLRSLGKQHRSNHNRKLSHFCKSHRVAFDFISDPLRVEREFEDFRALHDAQWRADGKLGHFGDWPAAENFNRDLVRTLGKQGMVRFYRILADDQVVSSQFSFVFGGTNYWRLPARACSETWGRFSFGYMGLVKMFETSITEGHTLVEGGRGHYPYKLHIGGREWPLRIVQFERHGFGVSARVRLFRAFASLLDLVYYKVLFARVSLRISALQRPLWPVWIRSTW